MRASIIITAATVLTAGVAHAQSDSVGVDEKLGTIVPLEELTFSDEEGKPITLAELADKPIILSLVFFRCTGLCTPLLNEIARVTDIMKLTPGEDYRLVSVSFDVNDTAGLAKIKKRNQLQRMKLKTPGDQDWRFLTGTQENIDALTSAVGFNYMATKEGDAFNHPGVVVFLSDEGKICRYLHGTSFNPIDVRMAVEDASAGRPRSLIRKLTQLCFA